MVRMPGLRQSGLSLLWRLSVGLARAAKRDAAAERVPLTSRAARRASGRPASRPSWYIAGTFLNANLNIMIDVIA